MRTASQEAQGIAVGGKTVLRSFSVTDIGKKRKLNQDFVYVSEISVGNLPNVFVVADGMGGHNAGDYASKCTVETMVREIRGCFEKNPIRILGKAIMAANDQIRQRKITAFTEWAARWWLQLVLVIIFRWQMWETAGFTS